jgi:hypothetical protein
LALPAVFLEEARRFPKHAGLHLGGGDGSSLEKAIVIKGAKGEEDGVHAEYAYLSQHFPGAKPGQQSLQGGGKGKKYDGLEFTTGSGERKTLYFDITVFFGK